MARIIVQSDGGRVTTLDERSVRPEHLNDQHSAIGLLDRLEWAIRDAENKTRRPRVRSGPVRPIAGVTSGVGTTFD